jgi:hypothetical protein
VSWPNISTTLDDGNETTLSGSMPLSLQERSRLHWNQEPSAEVDLSRSTRSLDALTGSLGSSQWNCAPGRFVWCLLLHPNGTGVESVKCTSVLFLHDLCLNSVLRDAGDEVNNTRLATFHTRASPSKRTFQQDANRVLDTRRRFCARHHR